MQNLTRLNQVRFYYVLLLNNLSRSRAKLFIIIILNWKTPDSWHRNRRIKFKYCWDGWNYIKYEMERKVSFQILSHASHSSLLYTVSVRALKIIENYKDLETVLENDTESIIIEINFHFDPLSPFSTFCHTPSEYMKSTWGHKMLRIWEQYWKIAPRKFTINFYFDPLRTILSSFCHTSSEYLKSIWGHKRLRIWEQYWKIAPRISTNIHFYFDLLSTFSTFCRTPSEYLWNSIEGTKSRESGNSIEKWHRDYS